MQEPFDCVSTVVEHEDDWLQAQMHHRRQLLDSQLSVEFFQLTAQAAMYMHSQTAITYKKVRLAPLALSCC